MADFQTVELTGGWRLLRGRKVARTTPFRGSATAVLGSSMAPKVCRDVGQLSCFKQIIFPNQEPTVVRSTAQSDFVRHHLLPERFVKDTESILTRDQVEGKFSGATSYLEDYNKKSMARNRPMRSEISYSKHFLQHAGCDRMASTYTDHFHPRETST